MKFPLRVITALDAASAANDPDAAYQAVAGHTRKCGSCTYCCTHIGVGDKPAGVKCEHEIKHKGCGIQADKPTQCKHYFCLWAFGFGSSKDSPRETGVIVDGGTSEDEKPILRVFEVWEGAYSPGTRASRFVTEMAQHPSLAAVVVYGPNGQQKRVLVPR